VVDGSRLSVFVLYLAFRLGESGVTVADKGNTISGCVFRRRCVLVFDWHQLQLTGSRWDIRWVSGGGRKPTFCVSIVFSVSVEEECCDACR
jgi:hypothetical protein